MADKVNQLVADVIEDERKAWEKRCAQLCKTQQFIAALLQGTNLTPTEVDTEHERDEWHDVQWSVRIDFTDCQGTEHGCLTVTPSREVYIDFATGVYGSDSYTNHGDQYNIHVDEVARAINKCLAADPANPCKHMRGKKGGKP
jgi:hypothetical protein